ncbi:MAG: hypothetical protein M8357_04890 [Desulfobulbaceae bacterium]|nr:hypothetical protein [Desulfobulbaceae bacterium]
MEKKYLCLLIGALLLFAGCGGDDQNRENSSGKQAEVRTSRGHAADSGLKEPCELITRAEAGRLIGEDVNDGQYGEQKVVGLKKCFYEAANSDKFLQVTVQQPAFMPRQTLEAGQSPRVIFAETKKMLADGRDDLSGMGDEAFIGTGGLHMLTGDYYITIGVGTPDREGNRQILEAAGRLVLDKLQR